MTALASRSDHAARLARARLSLDGLSVGDAFGERHFCPWTFGPDGSLPPPPWEYTDDTEMAIAVVDVLAKHGTVDQDDLAATFARRYAADDRRGYGAGAHFLLTMLGKGRPWREESAALFDGQGSMGNGSAMRVAPLGAYFADHLPSLVDEARRSAEVTHWNDEGRAGAVAIALAAAFACNHVGEWKAGGERGYTPARVREFFEFVLAGTPESQTRDGIARAVDLPRSSEVLEAAALLGNGSRVTCPDTVPLCVWLSARHLGRYADALRATAGAGGDVDTTCAIVGGVVCLSEPAANGGGIPRDWLRSREPLDLPPGLRV